MTRKHDPNPKGPSTKVEGNMEVEALLRRLGPCLHILLGSRYLPETMSRIPYIETLHIQSERSATQDPRELLDKGYNYVLREYALSFSACP